MRKILAVTGIRSEYDILYPIIKVLKDSGIYQVKLVVSGAHLSDWHGNTVDRIVDDGFEIAEKIDSLFMTNRATQRIKGVGVLTYALSQTVEREKPDFLLVVGDREESIATALVGNYMNVCVVHVGGGDPVYGNADDPIRFAVSKLSHVHFTIADSYADNLKSVGEEGYRIHWVGNPAYWNIAHEPVVAMNELSKFLEYNISEGNYIVLIKHPLSSEKDNAYEQMKITLEALTQFALENEIKIVGIYPNTDPGSYDIMKAVHQYESKSDILRFYRTIPKKYFVNVMRNCLALVGNSSMGILEAPFYKLPVVNIGNRQRGRLNAGNVEFVGYDAQLIKNALGKACFDSQYRGEIKTIQNPFGDENAPSKIYDVLSKIDPSEKRWLIKKKLC